MAQETQTPSASRDVLPSQQTDVENGEIFPSSLLLLAEGRKKGLSGDNDGLGQEGLGGGEMFLHSCITQALAGFTEGLKIEISC